MQSPDTEDLSDDDYTRGKNTMFKFWLVCGKPPCKRARSCKGEPHGCFKRHWAMMPPCFKLWFVIAVKAMSEGHTPEQASRIGDEHVERMDAMVAQFAEAGGKASGSAS